MQNTDKTLAIALIISFASHSFMFFPAGKMSLFNHPKKPTKIEVTYIAPIQKNNKKTADAYTKADNLNPKTLKQASLPAAKVEPLEPQTLTKNKSSKIKAVEKAMTKAHIDIKKSTTNLGYHQLVKAWVKNYSSYPNSIGQGEVNLSFKLSSDGQLKIIKINEDTSSNDHKLRLAAVECINQANPFPPFPDNFDMQEDIFNVTISFISE